MTVLRHMLLGAAMALASAGSHAWAETRIVQGGQLVLTSTLGKTVSIVTDPTLSRSMRLSADDALSCLSVVEGQTATIGTAACDSELEGLQIAVPPDMAVTLTAIGGGTVHVGDLRAPLTATMIGGGDMKAGAVRGLVLTVHGGGDASVGEVDGAASLQLTGGGDARLASLRGPLTVRHTGSGDLAVGSIVAQAVDLENSGSGDTLIGGGTIGALHVRMVGKGDLAIAASVAGGEVSASGGGDIKLGQVTGALARSASGGSDIVMGGPAVVNGIIADIADGVGKADDLPGKHGRTVSFHASSDFMHFLMVVVVGVTVFLIWRIIRRGGSAGFGRQGGPAMPDKPMHPGVVAVADTMARLDQRLGSIESYVTTREFDLNRKFRDLK